MERHHRKPKSLGGKGHAHNISKVSRHHHRAWHLLFVNHDVFEICRIINETWLDKEWYLVPVRRK